jgi:hypothetical protein
MNLKYLGDALDYWKGSVFERLQTKKLLQGFCVDAMASDKRLWKEADTKLYAELLRINQSQLIRHDHDLSKERAKYFSELPTDGDVFLDSDTGIATGEVTCPAHYVRPVELQNVMQGGTRRLVIVYQHIRAQRARDRVERILAVLNRRQFQFSCTSYESPTVALLFFGAKLERVKAVHDFFKSFLGAHAKKSTVKNSQAIDLQD